MENFEKRTKILLEYAMKAANEAGMNIDDWSIGGGTILSFYYQHRLSKDIDIFISDGQFLAGLSPRLNSICEDALDYDEMGTYISLVFPEGKVDFVIGSQITEFKASKHNFLGKEVYLDDPVEIVCKKMFYRGAKLLPRDLFDLAVVYSSDRKGDLVSSINKIYPQFVQFSNSFMNINRNLQYSTAFENMILPDGKSFIGSEIEICKQLVADVVKARNSGKDDSNL